MMPRVSRWLPAGLALSVALSGCVASSTTSSPGSRPGGPSAGQATAAPAAAPKDEKAANKPQDGAKSDLPDLGKAKEITGKDQDDKEFKLSDYRGKVVLLDFWGNW